MNPLDAIIQDLHEKGLDYGTPKLCPITFKRKATRGRVAISHHLETPHIINIETSPICGIPVTQTIDLTHPDSIQQLHRILGLTK